MTIAIVATLTVAEGKNAAFEAVFTELVKQVNRHEVGCNFYQLHKSRKDSQVYVVLEQYADKEAQEAHGHSEHFIAAGKQLGGLLAAAPAIEYFDGV